MENGKNARVIAFLQGYTGKSALLLLDRLKKKHNIGDLDSVGKMESMNFADSLISEILAPLLSKGRLQMARSQLLGIMELSESAEGMPDSIDGVRVLPENIKDEESKHYESISGFIIKQEMQKYGLKTLREADSQTRIRIIEAFVEGLFGPTGRSIVEAKIGELSLKDLTRAPAYNRILLIEYILQSMLAFYVGPSKARMLRSELASIMDVDVSIIQGPNPQMEEVMRRVEAYKEKVRVTSNPAIRQDFEDLSEYYGKQAASELLLSPASEVNASMRNQVLTRVLSRLLGGMTEHAFSYILTQDETVKSKFMLRYLKNYLLNLMSEEDADAVVLRVKGGSAVA